MKHLGLVLIFAALANPTFAAPPAKAKPKAAAPASAAVMKEAPIEVTSYETTQARMRQMARQMRYLKQHMKTDKDGMGTGSEADKFIDMASDLSNLPKKAAKELSLSKDQESALNALFDELYWKI
ncbi:hypothetical protein BH11PSE2_BH11PSE2_09600 [soil metagenome]